MLDISNITASCRVGFKKRGEQVPTDFVDVRENDSIGKVHVTGSNFIEYYVKEQHEDQPLPKRSAFQVMMAAALVQELPPQAKSTKRIHLMPSTTKS